jgi:hypothetical protein
MDEYAPTPTDDDHRLARERNRILTVLLRARILRSRSEESRGIVRWSLVRMFYRRRDLERVACGLPVRKRKRVPRVRHAPVRPLRP